VIWLSTTPETYRAIYSQHKGQLKVFGSFTQCDTDSGLDNAETLTEWGFHCADQPLIKHHHKGDTSKYYIAVYTKEGE
jgi:hypothetical protein